MKISQKLISNHFIKTPSVTLMPQNLPLRIKIFCCFCSGRLINNIQKHEG